MLGELPSHPENVQKTSVFRNLCKFIAVFSGKSALLCPIQRNQPRHAAPTTEQFQDKMGALAKILDAERSVARLLIWVLNCSLVQVKLNEVKLVQGRAAAAE